MWRRLKRCNTKADFSASGGVAMRWKHVEVAVSGGGFLAAPVLGGTPIRARLWLDVVFYIPQLGSNEPITPETAY